MSSVDRRLSTGRTPGPSKKHPFVPCRTHVDAGYSVQIFNLLESHIPRDVAGVLEPSKQWPIILLKGGTQAVVLSGGAHLLTQDGKPVAEAELSLRPDQLLIQVVALILELLDAQEYHRRRRVPVEKVCQ